MKSPILVFSDLDGTLLDHRSYSWMGAETALSFIKKESIPLIFCSSKTRWEILPLREKLDNHDPFISENGGAIFIPENYFPFSFEYTKKEKGYQIIEFGFPYSEIKEHLRKFTQKFQINVKGYADLSSEEIAFETGLPLVEAKLAKQREYDEPFRIENATDDQVKMFLDELANEDLQWTKGGRYYHLTGKSDKGRAVKELIRLFRKKEKRIITIALGDNQNDFPMFSEVDYPILVQNSEGTYTLPPNHTHLELAEGMGPVGWNQAILKRIALLRK
ncbi:MAG TPA: HAD-IIB family hydrolase [Nitrospiria bacterium]